MILSGMEIKTSQAMTTPFMQMNNRISPMPGLEDMMLSLKRTGLI